MYKYILLILIFLLSCNYKIIRVPTEEKKFLYEMILNEEFPKTIKGRDIMLNNTFLTKKEVKASICKYTTFKCSSLQFEEEGIFIEELKIERPYLLFNDKEVNYDFRQFPKSFGLTSFSNIIYTKNQNQVLIYIQNYVNGWDAFGKLYLMERKTNKKWEIMQIYDVWIS